MKIMLFADKMKYKGIKNIHRKKASIKSEKLIEITLNISIKVKIRIMTIIKSFN